MPIKYVDGKKVHLPYPKKNKKKAKKESRKLRQAEFQDFNNLDPIDKSLRRRSQVLGS